MATPIRKLRMIDEDYATYQEAAEARGISFTELVHRALEAYLAPVATPDEPVATPNRVVAQPVPTLKPTTPIPATTTLERQERPAGYFSKDAQSTRGRGKGKR